MNFSRCDIDENDLKIKSFIAASDSQELKIVVEKAFKVAAQDAGVKHVQSNEKKVHWFKAAKGLHDIFLVAR